MQAVRRVVSIGIVMAVAITASAAAASSYDVINGPTQPGMLMSATTTQGVVEPANNRNAASLLGVIDSANADLEQQVGQVGIQTDGQADVLVSTLNGSIVEGDKIAPSVLQGIGAKVTTSGWIVGIAQTGFSATNDGAVQSTISDVAGNKHQVAVGRVPVVLHVTYYRAGETTSNTPQTYLDKLAGKHASELGILLSFVLLFVGLLIVGLVTKSIIQSSFMAMSRQPLIRSTMLKSVAISFLFAAFILVVVLGGSYLLLRSL